MSALPRYVHVFKNTPPEQLFSRLVELTKSQPNDFAADALGEAALYAVETGCTLDAAWIVSLGRERSAAKTYGRAPTSRSVGEAAISFSDFKAVTKDGSVTPLEEVFYAPQADEEPENQPYWLTLIQIRLEKLTRGAPTPTERGYAKRSLLVLDILQELVAHDEHDNSLIIALSVDYHRENTARLTPANRSKLYEQVKAELTRLGHPVSIDYIKHLFMFLRRELKPLLDLANIQI